MILINDIFVHILQSVQILVVVDIISDYKIQIDAHAENSRIYIYIIKHCNYCNKDFHDRDKYSQLHLNRNNKNNKKSNRDREGRDDRGDRGDRGDRDDREKKDFLDKDEKNNKDSKPEIAAIAIAAAIYTQSSQAFSFIALGD